MTITADTRHTTYSDIEQLLALPGSIHIRINKLDGYFVPFVFYTAPKELPVGHGPIVQGEELVASLDLDPLVQAIRETLGNVEIFAPKDPGPSRVVH